MDEHPTKSDLGQVADKADKYIEALAARVAALERLLVKLLDQVLNGKEGR